jgi:DNA-3-methyladenine glycosylase I
LTLPAPSTNRCAWATTAHSIPYHDHEWGTPLHDERALFEFVVLEGAQAGLSWETILRKRDAYRSAFDNFQPHLVAAYGETKVAELLANPGIVRNRLKIASAVRNARAFLQVQQEFGTFDTYLWGFTQGKPLVNTWRSLSEIPARTPLSDAISKDLIKRGFNFTGSTICYALMQAVGMVNDHLVDCFRYQELVARGN